MGRLGKLSGWLTLAAVLLAAAPAQAQKTSVVVLGIRALEGDDEFARNLTGALRQAASEVEGWELSGRQVSLSQMTLAHGCNEADAACMGKVAESLEVDRVIYGKVRRTSAGEEFDFSLALYFFNADTGQIEHSVADSIPSVMRDIDNLRPRAKRYVSQFSGKAQTGALRVSVNVPGATVAVDGNQVGTADEEGSFVAEGLTAGRHRVKVDAEGRTAFRGAVTVVANEEVSLEAELEEAGTTGPEEEPLLTWPTYVSLGATAVFGALNIYSFARVRQIDNDLGRDNFIRFYEGHRGAENICKPARREADDDPQANDIKDLCNDADTFEKLVWAFGVPALVGLGASAYFLYRDLSDDGKERKPGQEQGPEVTVVPSFGPHGGGVTATVRY